jgi:hypothetical protein
MGWSREEWEAKASELSAIYVSDKTLAAWQLRQHRHFIEVPGQYYDLVSLHTVIFGLRGGQMGDAFRSGQSLEKLRPSLAEAGFDEVLDVDPKFEDVWERYIGLCSKSNNKGPSGGAKNPPRKRSFFVTCEAAQIGRPWSTKQRSFQKSIALSSGDSQSARLARLAFAPKKAEQILTTVVSWNRNPDVVAEALYRANGVCGMCKKNAPFKRKVDNTPFLEVHHVVPLSAEGGDDTIENVIALCPNCHRRAHYG